MSAIYLVTDASLCDQAGHTLEFVVEAALQAGVRWIQLREKEETTRNFVRKAQQIQQLTQAYGAKLIINDRIDVALAIDADGVHVGQSDMPYALARRLVGPDKIVGLSVTNLAEWEEAEAWDVDYFGAGPIFHTDTKRDITPPMGLEGLRHMRQHSQHPIFAIGGIHEHNLDALMQTGIAGVAVVSAICSATDPATAARRLLHLTQHVQSS
ncbi:thiamine-phosphate pyrophosphorylase [Catalinimonas alkaloidigena]|uniref:Thiamine-phosphate synthase n=1 Tax=Catalinimonas alkaloidigena TaxID=1075417 RepID=A0A1G8XQ03_9BACT|nr:thiamine phosphate synthase [Catalinimonas alkaloidigena]SDJ92732.1 thiamine-phosphate pyrophosphorylase [Catalinimonas alkaloidigena]